MSRIFNHTEHDRGFGVLREYAQPLDEEHLERFERMSELLRRAYKQRQERQTITGMPTKFDMGRWCAKDSNDDGNDTDKNICGTAGCAVGHAMFDPWFNREGLGRESENDSPLFLEFDTYGEDFDAKAYIGFNAVQKFFGLNHVDAAEALFGAHLSGLNELEVAARVDYFIELCQLENERKQKEAESAMGRRLSYHDDDYESPRPDWEPDC